MPREDRCIIFDYAETHKAILSLCVQRENTKNVSPIAWQNTNLRGRYEFRKQPDPLNVDAIIRGLTEMPPDGEAALAA
jgi:hypothetical protein